MLSNAAHVTADQHTVYSTPHTLALVFLVFERLKQIHPPNSLNAIVSTLSLFLPPHARHLWRDVKLDWPAMFSHGWTIAVQLRGLVNGPLRGESPF